MNYPDSSEIKRLKGWGEHEESGQLFVENTWEREYQQFCALKPGTIHYHLVAVSSLKK